jgi:hypothetical protein
MHSVRPPGSNHLFQLIQKEEISKPLTIREAKSMEYPDWGVGEEAEEISKSKCFSFNR